MIQQFIFLLLTFLLGLSFLSLFKKNLNGIFILILSFPAGLSLWALVILSLLILGIPTLPLIVIGLDGILLLVFIFIHLKKKNISRKDLKLCMVYCLVFSLLAVVFIGLNYSFFSNDSWLLIIGGKAISIGGQVPDTLMASWGIFSYIFLSSANYFGFEYSYALFPLSMLSLFGLFFYGLYSFRNHGKIKIDHRFYFCLLATFFIGSSFFIIFNMFYIISNVLAAVFSFLSLFSLYQRLETKQRAWTALFVLFLIPVALLRLEGGLFFLIPVIIFISREDIPEKEKNAYTGITISIIFLWFLRLSHSLSDFNFPNDTTGYNFQIIGLFLAAYLVFMIYLLLNRFKFIRRLSAYFPLIFLISLTCTWIFMIFTRGLYVKGAALMVIKRYGDFFINLLKDGRWGVIWIALPILFFFAIFIKKVKYESVFTTYIISFLLLFNCINIFRYGWRRGWGDSGNRMLLQVVIIFAFYVFMKLTSAAFSKKESLDEN